MNRNNGNSNVTDDRIGAIKGSVRNAVDQGAEKFERVKHRVMDAKDQAKVRGSTYLERATTFIRNNPLKSVGIAFGVGYLGMRLFRR